MSYNIVNPIKKETTNLVLKPTQKTEPSNLVHRPWQKTEVTNLVAGGGFQNPSSNPMSGVTKTQQNLNKTVTGNTQDNKIVGTVAAKNMVNDFLKQNNTAPQLPISAPLSDAVRRAREIEEIKKNYGIDSVLKSAIDKNYSLKPEYYSAPIETTNATPIDAPNNKDVDYEQRIMNIIRHNPIPTDEGAEALTGEMASRSAKIDANPEIYGGYADSIGTKMGEGYLREHKTGEAWDAYGSGLRGLEDNILAEKIKANEIARAEKDRAIKQAQEDETRDIRDIRMQSLAVDSQFRQELADKGLTTGRTDLTGQALLEAQLALNNQVADRMNQTQDSIEEYENSYMDIANQNELTALQNKQALGEKIAYIPVEKDNAQNERHTENQDIVSRDKELNFNQANEASKTTGYVAPGLGGVSGIAPGTRTLAGTEVDNQNAISWKELGLQERDISVKNAIDTFLALGYAPEQVAQALGIPEGTKSWQTLVEYFKAETDRNYSGGKGSVGDPSSFVYG